MVGLSPGPYPQNPKETPSENLAVSYTAFHISKNASLYLELSSPERVLKNIFKYIIGWMRKNIFQLIIQSFMTELAESHFSDFLQKVFRAQYFLERFSPWGQYYQLRSFCRNLRDSIVL
jgi:hypothetical protein